MDASVSGRIIFKVNIRGIGFISTEKKWLLRFLAGHGAQTNSQDSKRDTMVMLIGVLAIFVLLGVAVASTLKHEYNTAVIDFAAGVFLTLLIAVYRFTHHKRVCRYIGVGLMYCLYLALFFSGAAYGTTYMWHYTFPFFAIFLLGANKGAVVTIGLFVPVFIKVLHDALWLDSSYYSSHFATRFLPSVTVALVFAYLFEKERERFSQQTAKAYEEQQQIIEERTQELLERIEERDRMAQKLRQSRKMEAIGTMASGVAHDLNNILTGIVTYPQLIRLNLPPQSPLIGKLESIEEAGKRAAAVVDDLLTIARDAATVKEKFDINSLIDDLLHSPEWIATSAYHPSVEIQVELEADFSTIVCSPTHIRKSLMNLLVNAVEATAPSGIVSITTENEDVNRGLELIVRVRDNGPGIADDNVERIFEPFFTTKKMGRSGSGLGLSVVWNTIEDHRGSITVGNTEFGAEFLIKLPASNSPQLIEKVKSLQPLQKHEVTGTILVVDDEPHLREIAATIVENLGHSAVEAASGEEAVEFLRENSVDLILLDMILGDGIGGRETYRQMLEINPDQKAVIVSGYSSSEDVNQTIDLGAFAIIKKPYTVEDISEVIRNCLTPAGRDEKKII